MLSSKLSITLIVAFGLAVGVCATDFVVYDPNDSMNYFDALVAPCPNTPGKSTNCASCLSDKQCGFDRSDFACKVKGKVTKDQGVFDVSRCRLIDQMQDVSDLYCTTSAT